LRCILSFAARVTIDRSSAQVHLDGGATVESLRRHSSASRCRQMRVMLEFFGAGQTRPYVAWRRGGIDVTARRPLGQAGLALSENARNLLVYIRLGVAPLMTLASSARRGGLLARASPTASRLEYVKKYLQSVKRLTDFVLANRDSRFQQICGPVNATKVCRRKQTKELKQEKQNNKSKNKKNRVSCLH
jgi:hypothetical protein